MDEHWRDHLYEIDHLKGGIGLRAYGQRDPLLEYKKEAYTLFEGLVREVREDFVQRLFRVQLTPEVRDAVPQPRAPRVTQTQHAEAQTFGGAAGPAARGRRPGGAGRAGDGGGAPAAPRVRSGAGGRAQRSLPVRQRQEVQEVPHARSTRERP